MGYHPESHVNWKKCLLKSNKLNLKLHFLKIAVIQLITFIQTLFGYFLSAFVHVHAALRGHSRRSRSADGSHERNAESCNARTTSPHLSRFRRSTGKHSIFPSNCLGGLQSIFLLPFWFQNTAKDLTPQPDCRLKPLKCRDIIKQKQKNHHLHLYCMSTPRPLLDSAHFTLLLSFQSKADFRLVTWTIPFFFLSNSYVFTDGSM